MSANRSRLSSDPQIGLRLRFVAGILLAVFVWGCDPHRTSVLLPPKDGFGPRQPVSQGTILDVILEVDPASGVARVTDVSSRGPWAASNQVNVDALLNEVSFICTDCGTAKTRIRKLELTVVLNDNTKKLRNAGFAPKCLTSNCRIPQFDPRNSIDPLQEFYTVADPFTVKFPVKLIASGNFRVSVTLKAAVFAA